MAVITVTHHNLELLRPTILRSVYAAQSEAGEELGIHQEIMYLQEYCEKVTPNAIKHLAAAGIIAVANVRMRGNDIFHSYVSFPGPDNPEDEIIADGTWGQFIPANLVYLGEPKVLLGNRNAVIKEAIKYGIPYMSLAEELWAPKNNKRK